MRIEAIPLQGVKITKNPYENDPSVISPSKEQWGRKWKLSLSSKGDKTEMVPIVRKVDVMYSLAVEIEKPTNVKKKKKKQKTFILPKNLIPACFGKHDQAPIIHSPSLVQKVIFILRAPAMRHGFVELSTLNITLLGRQPKFCKNPFLPFIFLIPFHFSS